MLEQKYGLKRETVYTIGEFSILWCYFDQLIFDSKINPTNIIAWASKREFEHEIAKLCESIRNEAINYLEWVDEATVKNRIYSTERVPSEGHINLIHEFLEGNSEYPLIGCSLFILRIRNNLFHGIKDIFTLNNQIRMFNAINAFIEYNVKRTEL